MRCQTFDDVPLECANHDDVTGARNHLRRIFDVACRTANQWYQVNRCPAQLLHAGLERKARACSLFRKSRAFAVRPEALVDLNCLDPARTLEQIIELVAREVLELQEMLDVRLECVIQYQLKQEKLRISTDSRATSSRPSSALNVKAGSRRTTLSVVTLINKPARSNQFSLRQIESSIPDHQPLTADIDDPACPASAFANSFLIWEIDSFGVGDQLIPLNDFDRRQSRRRRKLIPAKGRAV